MKKNISIIGFMGTGKSAVGRNIARELGYQFIDTDRYMEKRMGMTVADFFLTKGEKEFRKLEHQYLKEILNQDGQVIATGGGMVLLQENRELLKANTFVVCLKAMPKTIYYRTKRNNKRPLLHTQKPLKKINQLLRERKGLYEFGDITLHTDYVSIHELVTKAIYHYKNS